MLIPSKKISKQVGPFFVLYNRFLRNRVWRNRTVGHTDFKALGCSITDWSPFVKMFRGLEVLDTSFRPYQNFTGFIFSLSARLFLKKFCISGNLSRDLFEKFWFSSAGGSTLNLLKQSPYWREKISGNYKNITCKIFSLWQGMPNGKVTVISENRKCIRFRNFWFWRQSIILLSNFEKIRFFEADFHFLGGSIYFRPTQMIEDSHNFGIQGDHMFGKLSEFIFLPNF